MRAEGEGTFREAGYGLGAELGRENLKCPSMQNPDPSDTAFIAQNLAEIPCARIRAEDESVRGWEEKLNGQWIKATAVKLSDFVNEKGVLLKFGDSPKRTWWRTKQNLDYTFLMWYASNMSEYYMQLEDDVHPVPSFAAFVRSALERSLIGNPWVMASFSGLGFIGKLFNNTHLPNLANFLLTFSNLASNNLTRRFPEL